MDAMNQDQSITMTAGAEITRSNSIWFEDGNIVLQADHTQFCVHRGVLSLKSVVFKNMLTAPAHLEDSAADRIDGLPIVHVSDSVQETEYLLDALYNQIQPDLKLDISGETAPRLRALLRLSTKYIIPSLRKTVSAIFEEFYLSNLQEWDSSKLKASRHYDWEVEVANTLYDAQLFSPLPFLLYRWVIYDEDSLYFSELSKVLKDRIFRCKNYARGFTRSTIITMLGPRRHLAGGNIARSAAHTECNAAILGFLLKMADNSFEHLQPLQRIDFEDGGLFDWFCQDCRNWIKPRLQERADNLWKRLPLLFDFGSWDKLRKADAAYLENMSAHQEDNI